MTPAPSPEMVRAAAEVAGVCARPVISRVTDLETGETQVVPIACGHTREDRCRPCAERARRLRMQQCREGWHLDTEPEWAEADERRRGQPTRTARRDDDEDGSRRVRSTRRRQDAPELPRVPAEDRTIGRVFTAPDGKTYRPSMFVTLTLRVLRAGDAPRACPSTRTATTTGGRRSTRCTSRSWWTGSGRTCGAAPATRSSTSPPSSPSVAWRRTCTPRSGGRSLGRSLRQVRAATYHQVWWPPHDEPVYVDRLPVWTEPRLRRSRHRRAAADLGGGARRARCRPRRRAGARGAVRGAGRHQGPDRRHAGRRAGHRLPVQVPQQGDRRHLRRRATTSRRPGWRTSTAWPKRSAGCRARRRARTGCGSASNPPPPRRGWCRGTASTRRTTGTTSGSAAAGCWCPGKWSGKTLAGHKADRVAVVRQALEEAGIDPDDHDEMSVVGTDGRWSWELLGRNRVDAATYAAAISQSIHTRQRWLREYEEAKAAARAGGPGAARPAASVRQFGNDVTEGAVHEQSSGC